MSNIIHLDSLRQRRGGTVPAIAPVAQLVASGRPTPAGRGADRATADAWIEERQFLASLPTAWGERPGGWYPRF